MDLLTHTEGRRLLFRMAALSLAALLLAVVLGLAMTVYVNRALADTYAGIVGTVAQKYPQAEAQVVRDLSAPDALSVSLGHQVLGRYGLQDLGAAQGGVGAGLFALLLPAGLVLTGLACAARGRRVRLRRAPARAAWTHPRPGGAAAQAGPPGCRHRCF